MIVVSSLTELPPKHPSLTSSAQLTALQMLSTSRKMLSMSRNKATQFNVCFSCVCHATNAAFAA